MADEKKRDLNSSIGEQTGGLNESNRIDRDIFKSQIPDFRYTAPVPEKPSDTSDTSDKDE